MPRLRTFLPFFAFYACQQAFALAPSLMPLPAHVQAGPGYLKIDAGFRVKLAGYREPRLERAARRLIGRVEIQTGTVLNEQIAPASDTVTLTLNCSGPGKDVQAIDEDESYRLRISPSGAQIDAPQPLGILHGIESFLQLIQPGANGFAASAFTVDDQPRFPWRGLLLDVSRHFMPVEEVKRTLDGMAVVKLNVLHLHLSDNQGFRVESHVFPRLQQDGSGGLFYTQDDIRGILAYARDRGIRIIPEFDIPGHATGMLVAYPELAATPAPREIDHVYGVLDSVMDPSQPWVYEFLDRFIGEMAQLFPDTYFHIGGDEVNGKLWRESARIQQFKREHGMKATALDPDANVVFHAYFNQRLQQIVQKHGKRMVGWDEILSPALPKNIVIQSWRGQKSLAQAARQGYQGILSSGWYLDLAFPASQHYLVDPMENESEGLTLEQQKNILGGEAAMWSEMITSETADSRIWPRAAAVAERLWSPRDIRDVDDMYRRLNLVSVQLEFAGTTHLSWQFRMLERLTGNSDNSALRDFSELVEPVKGYERERFGPYTTSSPFIRFVDAIPPESEVARQFTKAVRKALADNGPRDDIRAQLLSWRKNCIEVSALVRGNDLLIELAPLCQNSIEIIQIGLEALDRIHTSVTGDTKWKNRALVRLKALDMHTAALQFSFTNAINDLINSVH